MPRNTPLLLCSSIAALAMLAACNSDQKPTAGQAAPPPSAAAATAPSGPLTPDPGGKIITIKLTSDGTGNSFTPSEVHAKRGDVLRFTLGVGVHNVHFFADSNAGRSGFPQLPSDLLQLPGQTFDVAVKMPPGTYYFQCDPHAALGMKGHLIVE